MLAIGQVAAAATRRMAAPDIAAGAVAMARTVRSGGVLHYLAAGSPGLTTAADAQEPGGTSTIPRRS